MIIWSGSSDMPKMMTNMISLPGKLCLAKPYPANDGKNTWIPTCANSTIRLLIRLRVKFSEVHASG